ncbi:MAG: DciA family protein [bacterium]|nr:DciA family protein [bacterium]
MNEPLHISKLMPKVMQKIEKKVIDNTEAFDLNWERIVGKKFSEHSQILGKSNRKILVGVNDSQYLFELNSRKMEILSRIKKTKPESNINDIKFLIFTKDEKDGKEQ